MKEFEYDVVVIGAGPGGSMAAKNAAERGADVLVIEKRSEVGTLVRCGEGISTDTFDWSDIEFSSKFVENEVDGARIFAPDEKTMVSVDQKNAGAETGYIIDRARFDKHLAAQAAAKGAKFWLKSPVIGLLLDSGKVSGSSLFGYGIRRNEGRPVGVIVRHPEMGLVTVKAKLIIGADGVESQISRWSGINMTMKPNDITTDIQYRMVNVDGDRRWTDFYLGKKFVPGGYIWVFPKSDTEANVGIGITMDNCVGKAAVKKYLDRWIARQDFLKNAQTIQITTGVDPVCAPPDTTTTDGVMLVGDAARLVDPLTGGGIANAMYSGMCAGRVAAEALEAEDYSKNFLQRYEKMWRTKLEAKQWRNYMAKEKLTAISDETLTKILDAISSVELKEISTLSLLKAVEQKYPELMEELSEFL